MTQFFLAIRLRHWLKLAASLLILALLVKVVDTKMLLSLAADLHWGRAAVAQVYGVGLIAFAALRWYQLIGPPLGIAFRVFLRVTFLGAFAGLFLPGTIGNEAVRVVGLARAGSGVVQATASIVVDRGLSLFSQFSLALALIWIAPVDMAQDLSLWAAAMLVLLVLIAALLMSRRIRRALRRTMPGGRWDRVTGQIDKVLDALDVYRDRQRICVGLALAVLQQVFRAVFLWLCAAALGFDIGLSDLLIALPVVSLAEMLPVGFAGLGTREAAFAIVLSGFGIEPAQAVAMSLLAFATGTVIAALPGGYLLFRYGMDQHLR